MGTLAEEILSNKIGNECRANDIIIVELDYILSHDTTTPLIINSMQNMNKRVKNKDNTLIFFDHIVPAASIQSAELHRQIRTFVREEELPNVFQEGISHQLVMEKQFAFPGGVIIGADSHSCTYGAIGCFSTGMGSTDIAVAYVTGKTWLKVPETINLVAEGDFSKGVYPKDLILAMVGKIKSEGANYKSVEFSGTTISSLEIEERMTLSNMAIEMGGKVGLIQADEKAMTFAGGKGKILFPSNPVYAESYHFNTEDLVPKISAPHQVDNVFDVEKFHDLSVDQVFIGTCTNGRISDLEVVAKILKGKSVHKNLRLIIGPASVKILQEAYRRGFIDIFLDAGATVVNPGCGPCIGRHEGVLAPGEVALTTMNRNFKGRMGSPDAEIYLSSPATAAVTSITGKITDPREMVN